MPLAASEAWTARTALLLGQEGVDRLAAASVAVFGLGGVDVYKRQSQYKESPFIHLINRRYRSSFNSGAPKPDRKAVPSP